MSSRRDISRVPARPVPTQARLARTPWTCALAIACLTSVNTDSQRLPLSNPQDLLATESREFAELLKTARPTPVSAGDKARILSSLPHTGEIINLTARGLQKLAALSHVLRATDRDSVYVIKVFDIPHSAVGLHGGAVLLISEAALILLTADELQAVVAHEVGHEYVWLEYERVSRLANQSRLKQLELVCDGIAIVTLHGLGMDPSRLMAGLEKISRFNRERFGTALNESSYPTLAQRRAFARALTAVLH